MLVRGSHHEGFVEDMPSSCMCTPGKKALILCLAFSINSLGGLGHLLSLDLSFLI